MELIHNGNGLLLPLQKAESSRGDPQSWLEGAESEQLYLFVRTITSNNSLDLSAQYENPNHFNDRLAYLTRQAEEAL